MVDLKGPRVYPLEKPKPSEALALWAPKRWLDEEIDAAAAGAHCRLCPLGKARKVVPPQEPSSGEAKFIVIGEGPGPREEGLRVPFVGPSGALLNAALKQAGLRREDAYVTNASLCRSDGERDAEAAVMCCAPRLYREIEARKHLPILTLGKLATRTVLGSGSILMVRGFLWNLPEISTTKLTAAKRDAIKLKYKEVKRQPDTFWARGLRCSYDSLAFQVKRLRFGVLLGRSKIAGMRLLPTIHPAFVLRAQPWQPALLIDVARFGRWVRGEITTLTDKGPYRVLHSPEKLRAALAKMGQTLAFDIETDGVDPLRATIRCVGIADGIRKPIVIYPWIPKIHAPIVTEAFNADWRGPEEKKP